MDKGFRAAIRHAVLNDFQSGAGLTDGLVMGTVDCDSFAIQIVPTPVALLSR